MKKDIWSEIYRDDGGYDMVMMTFISTYIASQLTKLPIFMISDNIVIIKIVIISYDQNN